MVLWSHWSGKTQKEVKACYSQLEKVNGSVLLTMEKLLGEGHQLHSCQIPGVLIMSSPYVLSDFPHRLSGLLDKALSKDLELRSQIYCSDGVLKTPILFVRRDFAETPMRLESLEKLSKGAAFYPYIDTTSRSDTSMLTIYVDDRHISEAALIEGLRGALRRAVQKADNNLPQLPGLSNVSGWSDVMEHYGATCEAELLRHFKVGSIDRLPDLSKISDWSELSDKYLKSREIIQKYLR